MNDVYVLNKSLEMIGIVDSYKSLIWSNRYLQNGDCELYLPATADALTLLQKGHYLIRLDDDMVCIINKIELDTDIENGNYLVVSGIDVKSWLDQRIIWDTLNMEGKRELYIRKIVNDALCVGAERQIQKPDGTQMFYLDDAAGFNEVITEQVSYKNVGEKVRELCQENQWGFKVYLEDGVFKFRLYKGTDRSDFVIFSPQFDNLGATKYTEDDTNLGNVALIGGEGEGSDRIKNVSGSASSVERFEIFVDAKDLSKNITWADLIEMYPPETEGGQGYIAGTSETGYTYNMHVLNLQILDEKQLAELEVDYPSGEEVTIDGNLYYQITDEVIADLPSDAPSDSNSVSLRDVIYNVFLLIRGYEKLAEYGSVTSFEGSIEPNTTFLYKQDYFLGDLVAVENEFGITANARIVEVVEVNDDNGYRIEPKFEYIQEE